MASQKSNQPERARSPSRERGVKRVETLLDAAAGVFAEKGFDAATMTEIAARGRSAIGSLYQFFPSKAALADALLERYQARLDTALTAVVAASEAGGEALLAKGLTDMMCALLQERASAIALLEVRGDQGTRRAALRQRMLTGMAEAVQRVRPSSTAEEAALAARFALHLLKAIPMLEGEEPLPVRSGQVERLLVLHLTSPWTAPDG